MTRNWIAVASANHVARGRAGGFMQVCHGKGGPLRRMTLGDRVAYYSPTWVMGEADPCRSFTSLGTVLARQPYQFDMGGGFIPFRRDVTWDETEAAAIHPLLDLLDFTRGNRNWGFKFRFGLFTVSQHDMDLIAAAMDVGGNAIPQ